MRRTTGSFWAGICMTTLMLASCGKNNENELSDGLAGDWAARSQQSSSFFANGKPGYVQSESSTTLNNTKIHFDGKGHFVFENYTGTSGGTYVFNSSDSLLTITPDSAAFLNYCYSGGEYFSFSAGSNPPAAPALVYTPGILYVALKSRDSLSLGAAYTNSNATNGDSIFVAKNGFIKL